MAIFKEKPICLAQNTLTSGFDYFPRITLSNCWNSVYISIQFSSVQSLSHVRLFVASWTTVHQASLSITNSQSLLKLLFIESVMLSNHLILCHPLLLLPSIFPSIRVFSNESVLHIRWPCSKFIISVDFKRQKMISVNKRGGLIQIFKNVLKKY